MGLPDPLVDADQGERSKLKAGCGASVRDLGLLNALLGLLFAETLGLFTIFVAERSGSNLLCIGVSG